MYSRLYIYIVYVYSIVIIIFVLCCYKCIYRETDRQKDVLYVICKCSIYIVDILIHMSINS